MGRRRITTLSLLRNGALVLMGNAVGGAVLVGVTDRMIYLRSREAAWRDISR